LATQPKKLRLAFSRTQKIGQGPPTDRNSRGDNGKDEFATLGTQSKHKTSGGKRIRSFL